MKYSIYISGSDDIDNLLTSLKTVVQDIEKIKNDNPDYLDGFSYEDHILMVSLNEES